MTMTMIMSLVCGPPMILAICHCLAQCALLFLLLPWLHVRGRAATQSALLTQKRFAFLHSSSPLPNWVKMRRKR